MRLELSKYYSDDETLTAIVYLNVDCYEIDYAKNDVILATESYINHNLQYHEDAAENYVLRIKQVS